MSEREVRKETRIRGSGSRSIQVDQFHISNKPKNKRSSLSSLRSALIKDEDIENLPRLRKRSTSAINIIPLGNQNQNQNQNQSQSTSIGIAERTKQEIPVIADVAESKGEDSYLTPAHQINQSMYDELDYPDQDSSNNFGEEPQQSETPEEPEVSTRKVGRPKKPTNRGRPKKEVDESKVVRQKKEDDASARFTKSLVSKRLRTSKLKKSFESPLNKPNGLLERIHKIEESVKQRQKLLDSSSQKPTPKKAKAKSETSTQTKQPETSPIKKVRKPKAKPTKIPSPTPEPEPTTETPRLRRSTRNIATRTISSPPVPLSKKRRSETQKPLVVNIDRLNSKDRDRRTKIHTLDVLKHLVNEFEAQTTTEEGKESILHESYKLHVLHHLDRLMDAHASINDISQKIAQVQKQKSEVRQKLYELKQKHKGVGNELNVVREDYNSKKRSFEESERINNQLEELQNDDNSDSTNLSATVLNDLVELRKKVNPKSGIYAKLTLVNDKLQELDDELA